MAHYCSFPRPGGLELATHQILYGQDGALVARDEYLAGAMEGRKSLDRIDYYGVTFDHLVPANEPDPEVLVININEVDKAKMIEYTQMERSTRTKFFYSL